MTVGERGSVARVLFDRREIAVRVRELGREISSAYPDGVLLVAVLKGSVVFFADLVRTLTVQTEIDFLAISHYAADTGRVKIEKDVDLDLHDRDVLLVEDIADTGLTLTYLLNHLRQRGPRSLATCSFLDKEVRRIVPVQLEFTGFRVDDHFVIGYGMDFRERYRNVSHVAAGDLETLIEDADAYRNLFYGQ